MRIFTDALEGLADYRYAELSLSPYKSISCFVDGFYPCDCHISRPKGCLHYHGLDNAKTIKKNWLTGKVTEEINLNACPVPSNIPYPDGIIYVDEFRFSLKAIHTKGVYRENWRSRDPDFNPLKTIVVEEKFERTFLNMYEGDDFRLIVKYDNFAMDPYAKVIFMSREGNIFVDANSEKKEYFSFESMMDPSIDDRDRLNNYNGPPYIENPSENQIPGDFIMSYQHWSEDIVSITKCDNISIKDHIHVGFDKEEKISLIY